MSDQINRPADELSMGEQIKRKFGGLDPFIPPAVPFEQIEQAAGVDHRVRRGSATRFRANAGAPLALVGIAAAVVLVLGSGLLGPKGGVGNSASPSSSVGVSSPAGSAEGSPRFQPSAGCSIVPAAASLGCVQPGASSAASLAPLKFGLSGSPVQVFSELGWMSSWSPGGTKFAFNNGVNTNAERTKIVDTTGKTVDIAPATYLAWVDDDTYLGVTNGGGAFVGRVGSAAQSPIPGSYRVYVDGRIMAAGGVAALELPGPFNFGDEYVIWSAGGITAARLGRPAAISRDGKLVAVIRRVSNSSPVSIDVVRTDSGDVVASYLDTSSPWGVQFIGFSPDSTKLAFVPYTAGEIPRLGILEVGTGRPAALSPCDSLMNGVWLSDSQILVNSPKCAAPADSGVTVATIQRGSPALSSDGKIASVSCVANCQAANPTTEVKIEDGRGGQEIFEFKGLILVGHLSFSADGSHLLIEFGDYERPDSNGSIPMRVVMVRV
jgi:hypothetical protein